MILSWLRSKFQSANRSYAALHTDNQILRRELLNFRDNFDCDPDAHKVGSTSTCRSCRAAKVLELLHHE